jgi:ribonuclease T1
VLALGLAPLVTLVPLAGGALPAPAWARAAQPAPALDEIPVAELPPQARHTLALIHQGGPFAYRRDGVVFLNRERRLPAKPRGYYREYTVTTPGSHDRGARRIIAGIGTTGSPGTSGEYWYTDDHYQSFRRIRE